MKRFSIFVVCISITLLLVGSVFCSYVWDDGTIHDYAQGEDPSKTIYAVGGEVVSKDVFDQAIAEKALAGASPEYQATHTVVNGKVVNTATGLPDGASAAASTPATTETAPVVADTTIAPAPTEAAPATNEAAAPEPAKGKAEVTFTDENGGYLGSSKVTIGTDVASSQFVQDVPDCNGHKFDHWDYDGHVIEHDYIIRAVYK